MSLEPGKPVIDLQSGEARFRLVELLARGENYDIALGEDLHLDDKRVAIKAIRYGDASDPGEVTARRAALHAELETLTLPFTLLPEPLDWLTIENTSDFGRGDGELARSEPLLVYELQHGRTMLEKMQAQGGDGIETDRALRIARELALFLRGLHAHERIFRTLAPEHVIVDLDDIIHVVGCGGITRIGQPVNPIYLVRDAPYVAPEVREARAAQYLAPAADVYSLGAVLTFLLCNRAPLKVVESPFDDVTFHRLGQRGAGVAKLVARMMHPDPARRFASIDALLAHLDPHRPPQPAHPDLAGVELPSPWRQDALGPQHTSSLSPGPLISVPREPLGQEGDRATPAPDAAQAPHTPPAKHPGDAEHALARRHRMIAIGFATAAVISVVTVIVLALLL